MFRDKVHCSQGGSCETLCVTRTILLYPLSSGVTVGIPVCFYFSSFSLPFRRLPVSASVRGPVQPVRLVGTTVTRVLTCERGDVLPRRLSSLCPHRLSGTVGSLHLSFLYRVHWGLPKRSKVEVRSTVADTFGVLHPHVECSVAKEGRSPGALLRKEAPVGRGRDPSWVEKTHRLLVCFGGEPNRCRVCCTKRYMSMPTPIHCPGLHCTF